MAELKLASVARAIAREEQKAKARKNLDALIDTINNAVDDGKTSVILKNMPQHFADTLKAMGYSIDTRSKGFLISWDK